MKTYRISKYNPKNRDSNGAYQIESEWTSISDVGNEKYGNISIADYLSIEDQYIICVKEIMKSFELDCLKIDGLESNTNISDYDSYKSQGYLEKIELNFQDLKSLKNGQEISGLQLENLLRLVLREFLWIDLLSKNIRVYFGFDYYMYIECEKLEKVMIDKIENTGLFVD